MQETTTNGYRIGPAGPDASPPVCTATGDGAGTWVRTVTGPTPAPLDPDVARVSVAGVRSIRGFTSSWGLEFEPVTLPVDQVTTWRVTSGRSGQGAVPWLLLDAGGRVVVVTVHWSGNWRLVVTPTDDGVEVLAGLDPEGQQLRLADGESYALPAVSVAAGASATEATTALVRLLAAQHPLSAAGLPTEWNHWWPYEDAEIDEATFLAEAEVAAALGLDVAVLDAGWFGRPDAGSDWVEERGDWALVNTARFPHGLGWLADQTRSRGVEFGVWIEAEAVGTGAVLNTEHPELLARDVDGASLGYVCLGSPAAREHVRGHVARLVETTGARWVKWDFNLDPGTGCRRSDHGHAPDEGLLRHYLGLYEVLDALRTAYPEVVLEACSSGGLRIDAGLAGHVDAFFLSDPDWTEHHLACLWGAAQLLPPRQLLHWPQSEWRGEHRFQHVDYSGTLITRDQFDTKIRAAMLHRFGVSVRLTRLRPDLRARLGEHVRTYAEHVRPLLADGVLVPLTAQPLREEKGHRQPAFQLSAGDAHVVAAFRLPPQGHWEPVRPQGLAPGSTYEVVPLDAEGDTLRRSGDALMTEGLPLVAASLSSALWALRPVD